MDDASDAFLAEGESYMRTYSGSVGLYTFQQYAYPIISALSGIDIKGIEIRISIQRSSHLLEDVLVAIVVYVGKGDSMPFLQITDPGRAGDIRKIASSDFLK
jgi:hypothetical protein